MASRVRPTTTEAAPEEEIDLATLGARIRHARQARGLTLADLAQRVDRAPSLLSQIENGRKEPRLALLSAIARELDVTVADLMRAEPPSRRAALEIALAQAQARPLYAGLGLPEVRPGAKLPTEALEALVGLHAEVGRLASVRSATPEEARRANAELRLHMRARHNYFAEIEQARLTDLRRRRAHRRAADRARRQRGDRAPRLHPAPGRGPAPGHPLGDRPAQPAHLPAHGRRRRARPAHHPAADPRATSPSATPSPPGTRTSCASGSRPTTSRRRCSCPSGRRWTSSGRPRPPRRWPSTTCATSSPSPTRPPRTASPTWPPSTSTCPCTSCGWARTG